MSAGLKPENKPYTTPRVLPLAYLFVALLAMAALHYVSPITQLFSPPLNYLGIGLVLIGIGSTAASAGAFVKAGTPLLPFTQATAVVSTGLYRYTRNPMYLGMLMVLLGVAILLGSIVSFLPVPVFAAVIHYRFIRREEAYLEQLFGSEYLAYRTRVRRWL